MILTGKKIIEEVKKGNINIKPFDVNMVNPNSYNYKLGDTLYQVVDKVVDAKVSVHYKEIHLTDEGFVLLPNTLYLASTYECIGSQKYAITLIGRSSVGRLGLFLQVSAPLGHIGTNHSWTLELKVVQPLRVYPKMKIGQVSFWCVQGNKDLEYYSDYWNYSKPEISKIYKEFSNDFNWPRDRRKSK